MKRKFTYTRVYGTKDPKREQIRLQRRPKVRCVCKTFERLPERDCYTVHYIVRPESDTRVRDRKPFMFTACGKAIHPKVEVSTTRRGIFFSTEVEKVNCKLCLEAI